MHRLPYNHNAYISTKSSSRVFVALYVNAECEHKDKLDEVGVDCKSTKLKITNRLLTNNYIDFPQEMTSTLILSFMNKYITTFPLSICC